MRVELNALQPIYKGCRISLDAGCIEAEVINNPVRIKFDFPKIVITPQQAMWLSAMVIHTDRVCADFRIYFYESEPNEDYKNYTFFYNVKLMPDIRARVNFCMKYLDGSVQYPPLEPGTLKSKVGGRGISPVDIKYMVFGFSLNPGSHITISDIMLTDEKPLPVKPDRFNVDQFGQWKDRKWPGKINSYEELREKLYNEMKVYPTDEIYKTLRGKKLTEGTGWFSTAKDSNGRWWLTDIDGYAFFSIGCFGVYPGEPGWIYGNEERFERLYSQDGIYDDAWSLAEDSELYRRKFHGMFPADTRLYSFATANLINAFGDTWRTLWTKLTGERLRNWGINTLSMYSDEIFIRQSGMPFVIMLNNFPKTEKSIWRGFPDVYADQYTKECEKFAEQLKSYADNRRLIGYFLNNEPVWAWTAPALLSEKLLEAGAASGLVSHGYLLRFLHERYGGDIRLLNTAWETSFNDFDELNKPIKNASLLSPSSEKDLADFSFIMIRRYATQPSEATRKAAPNHLNLGMRFAAYNKRFAEATSCCFDVFSFNCYATNPTPKLPPSDFSKPFMITEFHFGAYDRGLPSASLVPVNSQEERAEHYSTYVREAAAHPACVGTHYFAWNDQPVLGRYDGENYQFGFVDICNQSYTEFTQAAAKTNKSIYQYRENV